MRRRCIGLLALAVVFLLSAAAPGAARIPDSLKQSCERRDAADDDASNGRQLPFVFCDDGVPNHGGRDPNPGADKAVPVPQNYDGHRGLPAKQQAQPNSGADGRGRIALDTNVSLPDPRKNPMPRRGYPLVVMMHGCCSGNKTSWEADTIDEPDSDEKWHYSNAWYASRGYVVLTYTARGFVDRQNHGSTGVTQIDDRRFEINDYQSLVSQIVDTNFSFRGDRLQVDPRKVVTTGGSYGGGFSWMALTDPTWRSAEGKRVRLAATAPRYGWTDLVYSLVPNGEQLERRLPAIDGSDSTQPLGFPKQSIVAGLYASGKTGIPPDFDHATFPKEIDEAFQCTESTDPFASNPLCESALKRTLPSFIVNKSAYYQNHYFRRLARGSRAARVPLFSAGTLTDTVFPGLEHRRMTDRLRSIDGEYPVQEYYGDYQHFTQNKRKEWADLCADGEVCEYSDYPSRDFNRSPDGFARLGVTTRLNRLIDHYARPPSNRDEREPARDVTAALQICPENATQEFPEDQPGKRFSATTFHRLAPSTLRIEADGDQITTNKAVPNDHAVRSDPIVNERGGNDRHCPVESDPAGPGVATYTSQDLDRRFTMIGPTRVKVPYELAAGDSSGLQLNARFYDVFPDGKQVLVDRGVRRLTEANGKAVFDLQGNAWRFPEGHRIRIELAQDNSPYIKASNVPSSLKLFGATLKIPVREDQSGGSDRRPAFTRRAFRP